MIRAPLAERDEVAEDGVEEEAQPHALAAPFPSDAVHAVVPVAGAHERQPVRAPRERAVERATAVRVDVGRLPGRRRQEVGLILAGFERPRFNEGGRLVEDAPIAGGANVEGGDVRQPQQVVGEARARAAVARRMPPMEHVALDELVRGVEENLRARQLGPRVDESGCILELVAEAEGAARLVEGRAAPEPAGERLIAEPAVHHEVDGP